MIFANSTNSPRGIVRGAGKRLETRQSDRPVRRQSLMSRCNRGIKPSAAGAGTGLAPAFLILLSALCGCTNFHVTQTDESPQRKIRSDITATAWFSSAQSVAKLQAIQTDKTQSFGTVGMQQQGATNVVEGLKALSRILELMRPTP